MTTPIWATEVGRPRVELRYDEKGWIDEVITRGATSHSEATSRNCHLVIHSWPDGSLLHVAYFCGRKGKVRVRARVVCAEGAVEHEIVYKGPVTDWKRAK